MTILKKITDGLSRLEGFLSGLLLTVIVLINFAEILQRNLVAKSFPWVQELSLILVSWVVFFGAAYIYKKEQLLCVDFLYHRVKSGAVKLCWEMVWHIVECAILVILVIYGCKYSQSQSSAVTYSLGINRAIYSIPLVYCSVSMLIGMIEKIYDSVMNYAQSRKKEA